METLFLPHLNTQTNSNLSFSFLKISQLVNWASEKKFKFLVITDYYPYEIIDFFHLCKEKGIKPVWGVKIFFRENPEGKIHSATIYPQNNKGYKEVIQKLFSPESPTDRIFSLDYLLSSLNKNCLIVLEAQKLEEITYFANKWILVNSPHQEVNYDNLFIGFNFFLLSPISSIAANIIPLLLPFFSVKTLTGEEISLLALWKKTAFNRYFFPTDTQVDYLAYLDTESYFSYCTDDKTFYQLMLIQWQSFLAKISLNPSFRGEKSSKVKKENNLLLLKSKCWQKLLTLRKEKEENYQKTLEKELIIIEKLNYIDYFLIFSDAVNYLRKKNIMVGPGRGSSVSSLVAYLLGITSVDPLQHKLFFERFLNEERKSLPDIDLDVEDQGEIFSYLQQKYSKNQVSRIVTRDRIGWKTSFKEAGKVCRIGEIELKEIVSLVGKNPSFGDLKLQKWQLRYPIFFALAEKIKDLYYNSGVHPAGIVIAENSLVGLVPLKLEKGYLLTLFESDKFGYLGLKKYDFLSLKETFSFVNFNFIHEVGELLKINLPSYQDINLQDEKTWELFRNFLLTDIFQLDTLSARELFMMFRPQTFSDLIIFLGLNRPGSRKKAHEISQAKITKKKIDFTSPVIRDILVESYGFIIFEEQVSQILAFVYNCSFAEAEIKRRDLAEKGLEKDFLERAKKKMSFSESNLIYKQITSAIGYTFNKAHAVAYSYLTYYIAYLKTNFFSEIIVQLLNSKKDKTLPYLQESFFYGFQIKVPDINYSAMNWTRKDKFLLMGFSSLKEYKVEFFQGLIAEREKNGNYKNWEDFLNRNFDLWEKIDSSTFVAWIKSGLFTSLQVDVENLLSNQSAFFRYLRIKRTILVDQKDLPFLDLLMEKKAVSKFLNNQREYEALGLYISYFSRWKELKQKTDQEIFSLLDLFQQTTEQNNHEKTINVYAVISQVEKKTEDNYVLFLQDIRSSFKLNIDANIYQENKEILVVHNELLFTLKVGIKNGLINALNCEKIISVA